MTAYQASVKTPFAHLGLRFIDDRLCGVDFIDADLEIRPGSATAAGVCDQIRRYLANPNAGRCFDVACAVEGTPFQKKVWRELMSIPPGEVVTYGELANRLGTSARAVGHACRMNPLPLVIPCHRVVSASGLGGYAGATRGGLLRIKAWLLRHEGARVGDAP